MKQISWLSGLFGDRQLPLARVFANRVLRSIADGEDGARELILRQREEEVRLILRGVDAALRGDSARVTASRSTRA